ncbi:hypothetical protein Acr_00g0046650 [Actinidia rufa]|uniref:Uncharacterized protein n=1 Tax=Actinidia rufa TaxID=165716 RepID=A0A7J0DLD3_9ERIC|nr:hypothetical protein Acr_00g0046650 [Actinidia rufa]
MENQPSEQANPNGSKARKKKQPRRLRTSKEEEALLVVMLDCFGGKWKGHNGFKLGYFTVVEKELRKLLPGTTHRAKPNIESKTHKGVSGMNGKAFPMFEDWQTLFGHDRATGEMAEDAPEVLDGTLVQTPGLDDTWNDCYSPRDNVNPSILRGNVNPFTPRGDGNPSTPMENILVLERPKKKAKLNALNEMMKGFIAQNNAHMEKLTNALGFKINNIIVAEEERLDAFFGIPDGGGGLRCHFLEITEDIRSMGLTILEGVTEGCEKKIRMCFVVELMPRANAESVLHVKSHLDYFMCDLRYQRAICTKMIVLRCPSRQLSDEGTMCPNGSCGVACLKLAGVFSPSVYPSGL